MRTIISLLFILLVGCGGTIRKEYFLINYTPDELTNRKNDTPYPFTLRVKSFDIEKVYGKPNIVYRESPYKLEYYGFRHWAVRPAAMLTDLVYKHISDVKLTDALVRRLDDAGMPDYELSALVEAIEEYDSKELWYAHLSIRFSLKRLKDDAVLYSRTFDKRKKVPEHTPSSVVKTLSEIMDVTTSTMVADLDSIFSLEMQGVPSE